MESGTAERPREQHRVIAEHTHAREQGIDWIEKGQIGNEHATTETGKEDDRRVIA
jgi:hypothetical protein